jgi:hypothetical protein
MKTTFEHWSDSMKKIRSMFFNWTPADLAGWESLRSRGMARFVLLYGMLGFGAFLFVLSSGVTLLAWPGSPAGAVGLLIQLAVCAAASLAGGLLAGLLTWWLEDGIYQRMKKSPLR